MALKGVPKSPEHRAKLAAVNIGKRHSEETKSKMRAAHLGRKKSPEHCAHISAGRKGIVYSDETRAKMSAAKKGKPGRALTPQEIDRFVAWRTGRPHTDEIKARMRAAKFGMNYRPFSKRRFYYREIPFRSSYEVRVAQALDRMGVRWEYERYKFDLGTRSYCPDFYLPDDGAFWEVKGYFSEYSQETVRLFRAQRPEPLVLMCEPAIRMLEQAAAKREAA